MCNSVFGGFVVSHGVFLYFSNCCGTKECPSFVFLLSQASALNKICRCMSIGVSSLRQAFKWQWRLSFYLHNYRLFICTSLFCGQDLLTAVELRYEERGLEWTISHPTVWTLLLQMTWRNKWGRTCNLNFLRLYYRRNRNLVIYLQLHSSLRPLRSQFIIKQLAIWWF